MTIAILLISFALSFSAAIFANDTKEEYWTWKKSFQIQHRLNEDAYRFEVWQKSVRKFGIHNLNPYSDRTETERKAFFELSAKQFLQSQQTFDVDQQAYPGKQPHKWVDFPPDMVSEALSRGRDWRAEGKTTRAKSQGQQPYCGTFSRVGAAESAFVIGGGYKNANKQQNPLTDFSVEEVVDCDGWNKSQDDVFYSKGFMSWNAYPFDTSNHQPDDTQPCRYNPAMKIPRSTMSGWVSQRQFCSSDPKRCEDQMATWIYYNGPMQGGTTSGVFSNADSQHFVNAAGCNNHHVDHGIIYAGFGTDPVKGDYWLIKNSWGSNWQDSGFIKVARGVNCGGLAGSAMAYTVGNSEDYFPGPSSYIGQGICSSRQLIAHSASSLDQARAYAKAVSWCRIFFYSPYSSTWGVYCSSDVNCQRDGNTNWNAYRP